MKMEVLAVQSTYGGVLGSNKVRDWTSTLTPPTSAAVAAAAAAVDVTMPKVGTKKSVTHNNNNNNNNSNTINNNNSIKHKQSSGSSNSSNNKKSSSNNGIKKTKPSVIPTAHPYSSPYYCYGGYGGYNQTTTTTTTTDQYADDEDDLAMDIDAAAVDELTERLLDSLREAKSRHLTCTEVSLPCDLTPSVAADIIRVSEKEPCGIRGCTIYIEFEDEPQNSRRIASLKVDPETVSTFEVYLTLRQDHRGWTALLPQFMKSLARTITISPDYTITKHKLYSADGLMGARRSYSFGSNTSTISTSSSSSSTTSSQAIATPTST